MWSNAQTLLRASFILHGYWDIQRSDNFQTGECDYVVGDPYSVITALVSWVLWWLRHHQPYSLIAGRSDRRSCD